MSYCFGRNKVGKRSANTLFALANF